MKLDRILFAGLGGFLGAALRYLISGATARLGGNFPVGTLIVNVAGGFLMGVIMEVGAGTLSLSDELRIFLTTGIMGGLTTFSTFSYETVSLFSEGEFLIGGLSAGMNLFLALFACWLGTTVVRLLV